MAKKEVWFDDARKIPGEVMDYIRKIAVRAIEKKVIAQKIFLPFLASVEVAFMTGSINIGRRATLDWKPNLRPAWIPLSPLAWGSG